MSDIAWRAMLGLALVLTVWAMVINYREMGQPGIVFGFVWGSAVSAGLIALVRAAWFVVTGQ